jgi:hypothetical protein
MSDRRVKMRLKRMNEMLSLMQLPQNARIIDLGGTTELWESINHDYHITLVNLSTHQQIITNPKKYEFLIGDACDLHRIFKDNSFDMVFSNSVIEHVGDESRQAQFAAEVHRLSRAFWIQTPSPVFPLEAHTAVPFYWSLPTRWRENMLTRWSETYPAWVEMLRETRVLSRKRMIELFPNAMQKTERFLCIEKSYSFYRPFSHVNG